MRFREVTQLKESFTVSEPKGLRGPAVADIQKALKALGFSVGPMGVDGIMGPYTEKGIKDFQTAAKMPSITGHPDQETVAHINKTLEANPEAAASLTPSTDADVKGSKGQKKLPPLKMDAATSGKVGDLLNFIARYESGGDYNIMVGGKRGNLTSMTVGNILDMQKNMISRGHESTAIGRYQYIRKTLANTAAQMGMDVNNTKFDEKTQDALAIQTLRTIGLEDWLSGKLEDGTFLNKVARVWASVPTTSGGSYYAGVGSNKAGVNADVALNTLQDIRTA